MFSRNCIHSAAKKTAENPNGIMMEKRNGIQGPISPQNVSNQDLFNLQKRPILQDSKGAQPHIAGFQRSLAPLVGSGAKPLFARPLARFLRQLRHFSRSRALARSLLSFLASSKSHPNGGKKQLYSRIVKFTQGGMEYKVPFRPPNVSNQYPLGNRHPAKEMFYSNIQRNT